MPVRGMTMRTPVARLRPTSLPNVSAPRCRPYPGACAGATPVNSRDALYIASHTCGIDGMGREEAFAADR